MWLNWNLEPLKNINTIHSATLNRSQGLHSRLVYVCVRLLKVVFIFIVEKCTSCVFLLHHNRTSIHCTDVVLQSIYAYILGRLYRDRSGTNNLSLSIFGKILSFIYCVAPMKVSCKWFNSPTAVLCGDLNSLKHLA